MMIKNIAILTLTILNSHAFREENGENNWRGKWFPHSPGESDSNPVHIQSDLHDSRHGIKMGIKDSKCDDGKTNLNLDWYMNFENYTCYEDKKLYLPDSGLHPLHTTQYIPLAYNAPHVCMNESIYYNNILPTFGSHRPLWAAYGEYTFVPRQRWIHNLEHGAVVMLYHPCANKNEVRYLKKIVKSCLYRHIITPYNLLNPERPLALVTWGHRLEISKVSMEVIVDFIKNHALKGPEEIADDGQYNLLLEQQAKIVSDENDTNLCPFFGLSNVESM